MYVLESPHIDQWTSRLNKACYAVRSIKPSMSLDVWRMMYFSYVHSVVSYGIIFFGGGNTSHNTSIFKTQKRINIVITGCSNRDSCCELLRNLVVLPLHSQYIFSLLLFVVKNRELFRSNSDVHNINTRYHSDLLVANL